MLVVPQEDNNIALIAPSAMRQRKRSCFKVRRRVINSLFTEFATEISGLILLTAVNLPPNNTSFFALGSVRARLLDARGI